MRGKQAVQAQRRSPVPDIAEPRDVGWRHADPWRSGRACERAAPEIRTLALTPREVEVLIWLARGKSGPEIAIILGIRTCTVRIHIQSIKRKLDASNIPHAITQGFLNGIL